MSKSLIKIIFYYREGVTKLKIEEAKKWEGRLVKVQLLDGETYQGKIMDVCNEFCDKWIVYFDGNLEFEGDEIDSIAD